MPRRYSIPYTGTLTNAGGNADLLELLPADDKPVKLCGMTLGQISEVGDAAAEGLAITVLRLGATVTGGSGGSAVTPAPDDSADTAAGVAAECNNSTVATTSGATTNLMKIGWQILQSPLEMWWPDGRFKAKQGEALIVRCDTTPADDISIEMGFYIEEE